MSNTTLRGQSFLNKVVELTGDIDNAFAMLMANQKATMTSKLDVGSELVGSEVSDYDVVRFFSERKPATGVTKILVLIDENEYELPGEFPYSF